MVRPTSLALSRERRLGGARRLLCLVGRPEHISHLHLAPAPIQRSAMVYSAHVSPLSALMIAPPTARASGGGTALPICDRMSALVPAKT